MITVAHRLNTIMDYDKVNATRQCPGMQSKKPPFLFSLNGHPDVLFLVSQVRCAAAVTSLSPHVCRLAQPSAPSISVLRAEPAGHCQVLVMAEGRVLEYENPRDLANDSGSAFAGLLRGRRHTDGTPATPEPSPVRAVRR